MQPKGLAEGCNLCNIMVPMERTSPITLYRAGKDGMSLEEFGKLLSPPVDKSTVLRWESGFTPVPTKRLDEIERLTGISRHELRPEIFAPAPKQEGEAA